MASRQDQFFKNYRFEQVPKRSGKGYKRKCVYVGEQYTWKLSREEIAANRRFFGIGEIATMLVFFSASAVRNELNLTRYIVIPVMLALVTLIFEVFAMWIFCLGKMPYQEDDYRRMDRTFQCTFLVRFILLALASVLSYVDTFRLRFGVTGAAIATGYLVCSLIAFFLYRKYQKIRACELKLSVKKH